MRVVAMSEHTVTEKLNSFAEACHGFNGRTIEYDDVLAQQNSQWKTGETAPRDGTPFLANIGLPFAVACCWNGASEEWCYAMQQVDMYNGHLVDYYFENTFEKSDELIAWMPMPEITNRD